MHTDTAWIRIVSTVLTLSLVIPPGSANARNSELQTQDPDVLRIAGLQGGVQQKELRQLLKHSRSNAHRVYESIFYYEAQLRQALRAVGSRSERRYRGCQAPDSHW